MLGAIPPRPSMRVRRYIFIVRIRFIWLIRSVKVTRRISTRNMYFQPVVIILFVCIPPNVISLQFCTPKVVGI
jgi:hypothetical protein